MDISAPNHGDGPADVPPATPPADPLATAGVPVRAGVLWSWALTAGLVAGLASWLGGESRSIRDMFEIDVAAGSGMDFSKIDENAVKSQQKLLETQSRGGSATFGILGATLGLALGLAGGLARRSLTAALTAALAGLVLGGAAGAGVALGMIRLFYQDYDPHSEALLLPMLVHGGIGSAIGIAAAVAFGIGLGGRGRFLRAGLGGLLGAIVATLIFEVVGALAFPMAKTHHPVSEVSASRLLANLVVALLVAAGAVIGSQDPPPKTVR